MSSNTELVYSATSTGSFATDFDGSGTFQSIVVGVITDTTGFAYNVDGGFGSIWSTGLVSATTASTGAGSVTLSTSATPFGRARLNVTRASTGAAEVQVWLGAI